jgi:hypothetical protein
MPRSLFPTGPQWSCPSLAARRFRTPSPAAPFLPPSPAGVPTSTAPHSWSHKGARVRGFTSRAAKSLRVDVITRDERPLLALVAVPLTMTASMDGVVLGSGLLWLAWVPLILCAWWWAPRHDFRWAFLLSIEAGALGAQWSYLGGVALGTWPESRPLVAAIWIAAALLLAAAAALNRWRYHSPGG